MLIKYTTTPNHINTLSFTSFVRLQFCIINLCIRGTKYETIQQQTRKPILQVWYHSWFSCTWLSVQLVQIHTTVKRIIRTYSVHTYPNAHLRHHSLSWYNLFIFFNRDIKLFLPIKRKTHNVARRNDGLCTLFWRWWKFWAYHWFCYFRTFKLQNDT